MVSVTTTAALPLLPILQRAFPDIISYQVEDNIVQASAEGFAVTTTTAINNDRSSSCSSTTTCTEHEHEDDHSQLFVKCVEASKYSNRPWGDLRRALLYSRTEARFYSDILPLLKETSTSASSSSDSTWDIAPKCYLAETYLEDLIGVEESTAAKPANSGNGDDDDDNNDDGSTNTDPKYDVNDDSILRGKGGNLVLESLKNTYYQSSPLTIKQASQCLSAAAKFHATAFQNKEILQQVSTQLCQYGGSYHLKNRNPKELDGMVDTWNDIVSNIRSAAPSDFFERQHVLNIGQRVYDVAEYVSEQLSPSYQDEYATIVHGDYKAMNVFLPLPDDDNGEPLLIDFASVGVGLGVSDIAMHIPHAVPPQDLENGGEEQLVEHYYTAFCAALPDSQKGSYSKEQFMRHYKFATVDYFRFIIGRMWKGLSLEVFEKRRHLKNFAEFNRTLEAALAFIERVDGYLNDIEAEIEGNKK